MHTATRQERVTALNDANKLYAYVWFLQAEVSSAWGQFVLLASYANMSLLTGQHSLNGKPKVFHFILLLSLLKLTHSHV